MPVGFWDVKGRGRFHGRDLIFAGRCAGRFLQIALPRVLQIRVAREPTSREYSTELSNNRVGLKNDAV